MSLFKCKMCGGSLEIIEGATVVQCEYCGTKQTLPRLSDERVSNLYDRANHFRRNNDYDKAMGIYEQILNADNTDAEAYWSLVLCRYGIEYVEDPATHKRIPTVNRAQFTSIYMDEDYKSALQYADAAQKAVYEEESKAIDDIQKGILEISSKEEAFDVFICYKETDANGRRTPDSVLANDLYHLLTQEGFKVFFARITLEDKLGSAYEPYIFAALNSAKVMVVLGTKPEYFNAVWVKNEWSRYLSLIKNGAKKMLIPAYKDMDPYDLPDAFSHIQAQDMSKLGFMQDLIRGIKKIVQSNEPKTTVVKEAVISGGSTSTTPLLKRAFMFLEDGDWNSANEYCEKVLDLDPECANAYLGKLMAELHIQKQEALADCEEPFDNHNNYQKAVRFGDDKLVAALKGYIEQINTRNENARLDGIYNRAKDAMNAGTEAAYKAAADLLDSICGFQDADSLREQCLEKAEICRKNAIYNAAKAVFDDNHMWIGKESVSEYEKSIRLFQSISGWKDADELVYSCQNRIEEIKAKEEAERLERERQWELYRQEEERISKRNKRKVLIAVMIGFAVLFFLSILFTFFIPNGKYNDAIALMDAGNVVEAYESLIALDGYKDSAEKANSIYDQYKVEKLKSAKVGDIIFFGSYEQDNNPSNGKEDVAWLVLEIKDREALVISQYALDYQQYNSSNTKVTWETCTLRKWLNNDFLNTAFSDGEKAMIPTVTVSADENPVYSTNPGNATQDRVFLLSITEANKYFDTNSARQCQATAYAKSQGKINQNYSRCRWWLRSPGSNQDFAAYVADYGSADYNSTLGSNNNSAVRPALWIHLDS